MKQQVITHEVKAVLSVGSYLVTDKECLKVQKGTVKVYNDGKFSKSKDASTLPVSYDEVCDAHDDGAVVYEATKDHKGLWT